MSSCASCQGRGREGEWHVTSERKQASCLRWAQIPGEHPALRVYVSDLPKEVLQAKSAKDSERILAAETTSAFRGGCPCVPPPLRQANSRGARLLCFPSFASRMWQRLEILVWQCKTCSSNHKRTGFQVTLSFFPFSMVLFECMLSF